MKKNCDRTKPERKTYDRKERKERMKELTSEVD
jgi:hypothetical protein